MATSPWDPGFPSGVASNNPNDSDVDGIDALPGWTTSQLRNFRSPWSELTDADVWIPGTYKGNGFILTSLPYPIMERDAYTHTINLTSGYTLSEVVDQYLQAGLTFRFGSLSAAGIVVLPDQNPEQYFLTGITWVSGSLQSILVILPNQPTDE